jgi:hypothetical protein
MSMTVDELADAYLMQGRFRKGEELYRCFIEKQLKAFGNTHDWEQTFALHRQTAFRNRNRDALTDAFRRCNTFVRPVRKVLLLAALFFLGILAFKFLR